MYSRFPLHVLLGAGFLLSACGGSGGEVEAVDTVDVPSVTEETPAEVMVTAEASAEPIVITVAGEVFTLIGDPVAGERVFRQCVACHVFDPEVRKTGPHLQGVFGRTAGSVEGVRYSRAMEDSGIVWTPETMGPYLLNPRDVVPGTSMVIALRGADNLDDLLAYIAQESGGMGGAE
ncbi:MAG: c-type cytochrome [Pseudomonadota bacterium]